MAFSWLLGGLSDLGFDAKIQFSDTSSSDSDSEQNSRTAQGDQTIAEETLHFSSSPPPKDLGLPRTPSKKKGLGKKDETQPPTNRESNSNSDTVRQSGTQASTSETGMHSEKVTPSENKGETNFQETDQVKNSGDNLNAENENTDSNVAGTSDPPSRNTRSKNVETEKSRDDEWECFKYKR